MLLRRTIAGIRQLTFFSEKFYACGGDVLKFVSIKLQRNKTTFVPGFIVVSIDLRCKDCTQGNAGKRKSG